MCGHADRGAEGVEVEHELEDFVVGGEFDEAGVAGGGVGGDGGGDLGEFFGVGGDAVHVRPDDVDGGGFFEEAGG